MSTIAEVLVEWMLSDETLLALIDDRLYPNAAPQDVPKPTIVYQLLDTQHIASRSGSSHLARSQFQFICEAETYAGARATADAARGCWANLRNQVVLQMRIDGALVTNDTDEYSEAHETHVVRIDVAIWHSDGILIEQEATT